MATSLSHADGIVGGPLRRVTKPAIDIEDAAASRPSGSDPPVQAQACGNVLRHVVLSEFRAWGEPAKSAVRLNAL